MVQKHSIYIEDSPVPDVMRGELDIITPSAGQHNPKGSIYVADCTAEGMCKISSPMDDGPDGVPRAFHMFDAPRSDGYSRDVLHRTFKQAANEPDVFVSDLMRPAKQTAQRCYIEYKPGANEVTMQCVTGNARRGDPHFRVRHYHPKHELH